MEDQEPLLSPMNKREREILARLATGLSDQQIATELFLSVHTVKWYNRQIFGKLGVTSRTQAITKARALGLLGGNDLPPAVTSPAGDQPPVKRRTVEHRIAFTTSSDGTRIAFGIAGDGPPLVKVGNYMGHVEYDWDSPVWAHWLEELSRNHMLIYYDERGSGLSDWNAVDVSFEAWVRDLEAVVGAAGLRRFPLFAMSQAGAVAVAYTARHPDSRRVGRLQPDIPASRRLCCSCLFTLSPQPLVHDNDYNTHQECKLCGRNFYHVYHKYSSGAKS